MTEEFISDDKTFCGSQCKDVDCPRHRSHIVNKELPHSLAMFKHTEDCPHEQFVRKPSERMTEGKIKSVCQDGIIEALALIRLIHPTTEFLDVCINNGVIEIDAQDEQCRETMYAHFNSNHMEDTYKYEALRGRKVKIIDAEKDKERA